MCHGRPPIGAKGHADPQTILDHRERIRHTARETIGSEIEAREVDEVADLGRDRPRQLIVVQEQSHEARQVADLFWDRTGELVLGEVEIREVDELADLGRN